MILVQKLKDESMGWLLVKETIVPSEHRIVEIGKYDKVKYLAEVLNGQLGAPLFSVMHISQLKSCIFTYCG
jgi:hypothetical protein